MLVNVLHSDLQQVGDQIFGQMALSLPQNSEQARRIVDELKGRGLIVEEVENHV